SARFPLVSNLESLIAFVAAAIAFCHGKSSVRIRLGGCSCALRNRRLLDLGISFRANAFATAVAPNCECHKEQIGNDKGGDISFDANAKSVAVEAFPEAKIYAIPRHYLSEEADE